MTPSGAVALTVTEPETVCHSLMVSRVYAHFRHADDVMQERVFLNDDGVARLIPWIGLFMGQRVVHVIWDVLNKGATKGHV